MNYHDVRQRRMMILERVEQHHFMRRWMIQQEFFPGKYGTIQCNKLLTSMVKGKDLRRFKTGTRTQYVYHVERKSLKWTHWMAVNEFHYSLARKAKIADYKLEYYYDYGQADGLYLVRLPSKGIKFFLEMDDITGHNQFNKFPNYERYFISREWLKEDWADPGKKGKPSFPLVLIITKRQRVVEKAYRGEEYRFRCVIAGHDDAMEKLLSL